MKDEEYKHIRNKFTRTALDALRQARRCEQFAYRLELQNLGKGKPVHADLNRHALLNIVKPRGFDEQFEIDLVDRLTNHIGKQITNTLLRPLLKRCVEHFIYAMKNGGMRLLRSMRRRRHVDMRKRAKANGTWRRT